MMLCVNVIQIYIIFVCNKDIIIIFSSFCTISKRSSSMISVIFTVNIKSRTLLSILRDILIYLQYSQLFLFLQTRLLYYYRSEEK